MLDIMELGAVVDVFLDEVFPLGSWPGTYLNAVSWIWIVSEPHWYLVFGGLVSCELQLTLGLLHLKPRQLLWINGRHFSALQSIGASLLITATLCVGLIAEDNRVVEIKLRLLTSCRGAAVEISEADLSLFHQVADLLEFQTHLYLVLETYIQLFVFNGVLRSIGQGYTLSSISRSQRRQAIYWHQILLNCSPFARLLSRAVPHYFSHGHLLI